MRPRGPAVAEKCIDDSRTTCILFAVIRRVRLLGWQRGCLLLPEAVRFAYLTLMEAEQILDDLHLVLHGACFLVQSTLGIAR